MSETKGLKIKSSSSAKEISKWSMVISGCWIGILSLIKAFWFVFSSTGEFGLTMDEIILSGITLAAIFTPVYLSIILDKIKDMKIGGNE
jgi:hypothetical protein